MKNLLFIEAKLIFTTYKYIISLITENFFINLLFFKFKLIYTKYYLWLFMRIFSRLS